VYLFEVRMSYNTAKNKDQSNKNTENNTDYHNPAIQHLAYIKKRGNSLGC